MIQASISGNENGDPTMMRRLFMEISDPPRVAALSKAIGALEQHGFPWNDHYIATAEPGHKVDVRLAGAAGDQFIPHTVCDFDRRDERRVPGGDLTKARNLLLCPLSGTTQK